MTRDASPTTGPQCPGVGPVDLLPADEAAELAALFKALADPVRVRLLGYLDAVGPGAVCSCHLPGALGIGQPTLSHHLSRLVAAGLVTRERRGRWAHYSVVPERLAVARAYLRTPQGPGDVAAGAGSPGRGRT